MNYIGNINRAAATVLSVRDKRRASVAPPPAPEGKRMSKKKRKKTPAETETDILYKSRRRCCLCLGLNDDSTVKLQGHIAHIDNDRSNNDPDNLVYLCINHHAQYDSKTPLTKGLTEGEVKRYRDEMYEKIERAPPGAINRAPTPPP